LQIPPQDGAFQPLFHLGVAHYKRLQVLIHWTISQVLVIVSFRMDTYAHTTRFALLKGRLTTTATTSWPDGAEAACFCPATAQDTAVRRMTVLKVLRLSRDGLECPCGYSASQRVLSMASRWHFNGIAAKESPQMVHRWFTDGSQMATRVPMWLHFLGTFIIPLDIFDTIRYILNQDERYAALA